MALIRFVDREPYHLLSAGAEGINEPSDGIVYAAQTKGWSQTLLHYPYDCTFVYASVGTMDHKELEELMNQAHLAGDKGLWARGWLAERPNSELIPCLVSRARECLLNFGLKPGHWIMKALQAYDPVIVYDKCLEIEV